MHELIDFILNILYNLYFQNLYAPFINLGITRKKSACGYAHAEKQGSNPMMQD